jgi:hypothetical protein
MNAKTTMPVALWRKYIQLRVYRFDSAFGFAVVVRKRP